MLLTSESANIETLKTTLFVCSNETKYLWECKIPVLYPLYLFINVERRRGYCLLVGLTQTAFTDLSQLTRGHSRTLIEKTFYLLAMTDDLR